MPKLGQVQRQGAHVRGGSFTQRPIVSAGCYGTASLCAALLRRGAHMSPKMSVGLYYSTSTGNTETVAGYIADKLGIEDWNDIGDVEVDEVMAKDAIIIGAPTWHTGADEQRSGTSWDEGFDYVESKGVKDSKFVGKVFDEDNYADDSEGRVDDWIEQLKKESFMC